jgi:sterol desaturase/sphingolipid hydroxylase (fatty acid hydroxylase superfamily)
MNKTATNRFLWSLPQPIFVLSCTLITANACLNYWDNPWTLVSLFIWLPIPLLLILERIMPKRKDWSLNWRDVAEDSFWVLATFLFWVPLYSRYYDSPISNVFYSIRESLGFTFSLEANSMAGLLAMAFLGTLVVEFIGYWAHRVQHRFLFLWRMHATHHHISKMSVARTDRTHPLEFIGLNLGAAVALSFLGASSDVIAVIIVFKMTTVHINHCNLPLTSGAFGWIFSTAEWHQVHHSLNYSESNTNYGCVVIIWDRIFGTFSNKTDVKTIGNGSGKTLSLWAQLMLPLYSNDKLKKL